jgi:Zn ribbon nucleic-acid-binding protein
LQIPSSSVISNNDGPSVSFPLPFCSDCAGEEEHHRRSLYWQAEAGLLTTTLCTKHGTWPRRTCPTCNCFQLALTWRENHLVVRCLECGWRPVARLRTQQAPTHPWGSTQLLFRLQQDVISALRDQAPSSFWFGPIPPVQFLGVVDDLYWLLRTPGLSATHRQGFTFTDIFSWTSSGPDPRTLFRRTRHWHFSSWDRSSKAELLTAVAATMLGRRAFVTLMRRPYYPAASAYYPWDWLFPSLHEQHAQDLLKRAARWPSTLRAQLLAAVRLTAR